MKFTSITLLLSLVLSVHGQEETLVPRRSCGKGKGNSNSGCGGGDSSGSSDGGGFNPAPIIIIGAAAAAAAAAAALLSAAAASVGADPHFKTWSGDKYDYHGECDLVMIKNPTFASDSGLDLHIRTKRTGYFSFIESAAVKIGSDVLEVMNNGEFFKNGENAKGVEGVTIDGFPLYHFPEENVVQIKLDDSSWINLQSRHSMVSIATVGDVFEGSLGMMGDWSTGSLTARDGETLIEDADEFALEWQVRDTEHKLFQSSRAPQYPEMCKPALKKLGSRLGGSMMKFAAEEACAWLGDGSEDCIFDVMATRNLKLADFDIQATAAGVFSTVEDSVASVVAEVF